MAGLYRDRGIVLRSIKLGEADRIVTFLTEGRGKVRAVAKGVRRSKSRFGARLEPTTHLCPPALRGPQPRRRHPGRDDRLQPPAARDYGAFTQAIAMLEAVDQVAQEAEANVALYRMLAAALRTLAEDPVPVVSAAFFWKLLSLEGVQPVLVRLRPLRRAGHRGGDLRRRRGRRPVPGVCRSRRPDGPGGRSGGGQPDSRWRAAGSARRTARPGAGRGGVAGAAGARASPGTAPTEHSHASGYHSWSCPPRLIPTLQT